ncbi:hypothetical protein CONLIGDRAFT_296783 [Coniochaeta ligniaria NRRL 30616]|uniref:Uncharacterized protein n=1 Tax=Coniochaeta ligniaria NRRL 30616 TaxID=1408157 RepID=A0A1J7ITJ7_9PEZI|nr:hypothetical protein CONLIGDRAFT_296783 [Coniochaeta ligniaria NRRL 30616]
MDDTCAKETASVRRCRSTWAWRPSVKKATWPLCMRLTVEDTQRIDFLTSIVCLVGVAIYATEVRQTIWISLLYSTSQTKFGHCVPLDHNTTVSIFRDVQGKGRILQRWSGVVRGLDST